MEKKFNRSMVSEISQKIQEVLSDYFKTADFEFTINGGNFTSDKAKLNLEVRMKGTDDTVMVSEASHMIADSAASYAGLKVEGHLIGSTWEVLGYVYSIIEYNSRRPKYPVSLKRADGRLSKATFAFLKQGTQITIPTEKEFTKWFTIDPDSDAVRESDVEIYDRVQRFLDIRYPEDDMNDFFEMVDKFNEIGIAKKYAKRAYELLFKEGASSKVAYLGLKVIYSEVSKTK